MAILITGGTKGIGFAVAKRLVEPGVDIFLNYLRDHVAAESATATLRALGAHPHAICGDVSTPEGVGAVLREVAKVNRSLDVVVHCAVRVLVGPLLSLDPNAFGEAVALNGASIVYLVQAARPLLRRGSSIVFLSSRGSHPRLRRDWRGKGAGRSVGALSRARIGAPRCPHQLHCARNPGHRCGAQPLRGRNRVVPRQRKCGKSQRT